MEFTMDALGQLRPSWTQLTDVLYRFIKQHINYSLKGSTEHGEYPTLVSKTRKR